jgi:formylglycine-generating enzyme
VLVEPLVMVPIEGGTFMMGSDAGQEDESPCHLVELHSFYLARCSVTNREYSIFLRETSTPPPPVWGHSAFDHPDQPVVAVNWIEAVAYCRWLSDRLREPYRLPTEAEREYACCAGTTNSYPWGNHPEDSARVGTSYGSRWLQGGPETAGGPLNAFGLCNMADNVHEWCADWYDRNYYKISPRLDPVGPESGCRRASRGGSWRHQVKVTRCSARSSLDPSFRYTDYGFRLACSFRREADLSDHL